MATKAMRIRSANDVLLVPVPDHLHGYEFVDGELVEVMPGGTRHGRLAGEVYALIRAHIRERGIPGRTYVDAGYVLGLRRDPQRMRGPDASFISQANLDRYGGEPKQGFLHGAPDLAVEVESAERPKHLQQRIQEYLEAGTRLVWVIHSVANSATVYRADGSVRLLRESDSLDGEDVLPGLLIPLRDLFAD
jgi:Uma2 family endonuclease